MWFPYSEVRRGPDPVGPYVAAINHLSHLDPPVAALALRRRVRFLALNELWGQSAILDVIFRAFQVIPLAREGRYPLEALKEALQYLASGGVVGVFPEGRRVRYWGETPLSKSAAWLALRADVPLVPVAVWGTQHAMSLNNLRLRRAPIRVVVCRPIEPAEVLDRKDPVGALTEVARAVLDHEIRQLATTDAPDRPGDPAST